MYVIFPGRNFNSILLFWLDLRSDSEAFSYIELVDTTSVYEEREKEGGNRSETKKNQEIGVKKMSILSLVPRLSRNPNIYRVPAQLQCSRSQAWEPGNAASLYYKMSIISSFSR